jgi:hypothetical protein
MISNKVKKLFLEADTNGDGVLSFDEFHAILKKADNQLKSLPSVRSSFAMQSVLFDVFIFFMRKFEMKTKENSD